MLAQSLRGRVTTLVSEALVVGLVRTVVWRGEVLCVLFSFVVVFPVLGVFIFILFSCSLGEDVLGAAVLLFFPSLLVTLVLFPLFFPSLSRFGNSWLFSHRFPPLFSGFLLL